MKKNTSNKSDKKFLKKGISDVTQLHKEYLGTDIPADYFENSKLSILNKIKSETTTGKFLKEERSDITKNHKNYLGKEIPEDYFKKSKISILNAIKEDALVEQKPKKQLVFYLRPQFKFIAAAAILFLLTLSIWLQNKKSVLGYNKNVVRCKRYTQALDEIWKLGKVISHCNVFHTNKISVF